MISTDPFQTLYREPLHEGKKEKFSVGKKGEGSGYFLFREIRLSRIAFGGYRIGLEDQEHKEALQFALRSGVNVIDVSANYGDGEAESLVGKVLDENFKKRQLHRKEIFLVTKAGYIQGRNMKLVESKEKEKDQFPEITYYQPGCYHCISPEFLEDQLERSRKRLGLSTIDAFLLHNPEYFLSYSEKNGVPKEEAQAEYYRRIKDAFQFLEKARKDGKIQFYGISSNTFPLPEEEYTHTSLSKCLQIAEKIAGKENGFAVVQFPANWYEDGFLRNRDQGKTLLAICSNFDLLPLINRPLNSFQAGKGMVRLSYTPQSQAPEQSKILQILELESSLLEPLSPDPNRNSLSKLWQTYGEKVRSEEQFQVLLQKSWIPSLRGIIDEVYSEKGKESAEEYLRVLNTALPLLEEQIRIRSSENLSGLYESLVSKYHPNGDAPESLSSLMVFHLASLLEKGAVLLGMRKRKYVRDILPIFKKQLPEIPRSGWGENGIRS
ncbi:aldo/keto reductase [Leptospira selangorensis]|uniref:Aldo/keto reductase n=1 Tax=Leptospira selangorensis TaxID=2484982 RepID=A0A5F2C1B5_9LEPT|nr:aldo/keto reductase [Leptospira selangorensis]TGM11398.1 aldo/keto reductase [Leptospira selangorensis]TGM21047.1 aldo/keto reductase [Leptospira selangorensis]